MQMTFCFCEKRKNLLNRARGGRGILGNVYVKLSSFSEGTILCPQSETCERPKTFTFWGSLMHSKTSNPNISAYKLHID